MAATCRQRLRRSNVRNRRRKADVNCELFHNLAAKIHQTSRNLTKISCGPRDSVITSVRPHRRTGRVQVKHARSGNDSSTTMEMMIGAVVLFGVVIATGLVQLRAVLRRAVRTADDPR